jgi:preprotein translocase subunit SecE|tara:strand:- start:514 stop:714 length:201 start_codon:yes stop_codon:yes gene_type:complete
MAKVNPAQFIQEVRQETAKVTWPSRKETTVSTVMVFIMVFVSALYFLAADQLLQYGVKLILGIGGN